MAIYRRLFTQPRKLAKLRTEFDAAVHEGSENGTNPELLAMLQGHAGAITQLMNTNWDSVINETERWPRFKNRKTDWMTQRMISLFVVYVEKTLRWLDYFVMDPRWLNLTAVNYAANAAREAASEVREARIMFEHAFELTRDDLSAKSAKQKSAQPSGETGEQGESSSAGARGDSPAA